MLLNDLFEKVEPGQRRAIQLQIDKYEKAIQEIERHEYQLGDMDNEPPIPGTEKQLEELKAAYQKAINDLKAKLGQKKGSNSLEKFITAIQRHCPTILKSIKKTNLMLYRGTRESAPAFYGKPYEYRQSKDSVSNISNAFNKALKDAGAIARRDNSIFTTTSKSFADMFGHQIYMVFPRDPMHYTWSDVHKDLVLNDEHMGEMVDMNQIKEIMTIIWRDESLKAQYIQRLNRYIAPMPPDKIIFDPDEFPVKNGEYGYFYPFSRHVFSTSLSALNDILPSLGKQYEAFRDFSNLVDPQAIIKNFGIHIDQDLDAAFRRGWEITINADYYAIRVDYEPQVRKLLGMREYPGNTGDSDSDDEKY